MRPRAAARANGAPWDWRVGAYASDNNNVSLLQWSRLLAGERLHSSMAPPSVWCQHSLLRSIICFYVASYLNRSACSNKHYCARMSLLALPLDVQRLLLKEYLRDEDAIIVRCACRALRSLVPRARIDACRHRLYEHFCTQGYTALLAWLHAQVPLREARRGALCTDAAAGGHLDTLEWLRANGAVWYEWTCASAARGGHVAVLQWLRAHDAPWNEFACARAARDGHLAVLQWLRANGAPWNSNTCMCAAEGGDLAVLEWARANGAPWDERTCAYAAMNGHLALVAWARANSAP